MMTPRKRSKKNIGLEPNLYVTKRDGATFYRYRRPDTGTFHGMGTDRQKAQVAARQLNARLANGPELVAKVMGTNDQTIKATVEAFITERLTNNPKLAENTKTNKIYRLNRIANDLGFLLIADIETLDAAQYLDNLTGDAYRQMRLVLTQLFDFSITKGWRKFNPVSPTIKTDVNAGPKLRQRLTVEQFKAIRSVAPPWFRVAMDIALYTCQGRSEVAGMKFTDIKDGVLYLVRQKTQKYDTAHIAIHVTPVLDSISKQAKSLPPLSQYIVHKSQPRGGMKTQVSPDTLSRTFKRLRDKRKEFISIPMQERPTFHEIRALGANRLEDMGVDKKAIQRLMGHADEAMTEVYLDGHGEKWVEAIAGDYAI